MANDSNGKAAPPVTPAEMPAASLVVIVKDGSVATVMLNRPEALNALSSGLCREFGEAIRSLDQDDEIHAVIVTGAGERAFSAGVDLKELGSDPGAIKAIEQYDPVRVLDACRKPVIGALNGVVVTGGLELALGCDILIASETARFADTHVRVGLLPGWGLSQRLSRIVGIYRARQMSLTGNFLDAGTALAWGLVSEVVPADELMSRARQLADDMASADPVFIAEYKALINRGFETSLGAALEMERQAARTHNRAVSANAVEGRRSAVMARGREREKRE